MKINWIIVSIIFSLTGGVITFTLTRDLNISIISSVVVLVVLILHNPAFRYLKAFYIVIFPILSNFYFTISLKTEKLDFQAGVKELSSLPVIVLGLIACTCLILDYLERGGKLKGTIFSIKKNNVGDIKGDNNQINQNNV